MPSLPRLALLTAPSLLLAAALLAGGRLAASRPDHTPVRAVPAAELTAALAPPAVASLAPGAPAVASPDAGREPDAAREPGAWPGLDGGREAGAWRDLSAERGPAGRGLAARRRFLVLGDSILFGAFGTALDEELRERGGDVWMHGSCGASSMSFLRGVRSECGAIHVEPGRPAERVMGQAATPRVDRLLESVRPDAALLVLGTNFLCCAAESAPDVRALVDRLAAARVPCLWVGLPSFQKPASPTVTRHYAMLTDALGDRCRLLDARTLDIAFRDVGDRVHVEPASGRQWAARVVEAVMEPGASASP